MCLGDISHDQLSSAQRSDNWTMRLLEVTSTPGSHVMAYGFRDKETMAWIDCRKGDDISDFNEPFPFPMLSVCFVFALAGVR